MQQKIPSFSVVDLFCGIGGLSYGLRKAGLNIVAGVDSDQSCEYAFVRNIKAKFIPADIASLPGSHVRKLFGPQDIRVLVGCAPCQPFSKHTNKVKRRNVDLKWSLLLEFARIILEVKPTVVSMENVPELIKQPIFKSFVRKLYEGGYYTSWSIVHCTQYGIPQNRKRLVLLASKKGPIDLIPPALKPDAYRTVRDAIGSLVHLSTKDDPLHISMRLSKINRERIRHSKPGGTWRDWPAELVLPCHNKESGKTYPAVYGRLRWDEPAPTITTQFYIYGTGRFGHPSKHRALSLREGALLQTFPLGFKFHSPRAPLSFSAIGKHIGNAVPPQLGVIIGRSIIRHLKENRS